MILKCCSELTWMLLSYVPRAYEMHLSGRLSGSSAFRGSKPFFFFSNNHVEHDEEVRYDDSHDIYNHDWKHPGVFPRYKDHYQSRSPLTFGKPLLIINNKYTVEWKRPPSNFIDVETLKIIIEKFYEKYQLIYLRPIGKEDGYWNDSQDIPPFNDYEILTDYPNVITMFNLMQEYTGISYNEMQMFLFSNCDKFISVAGGASVLCSFFGGTNIIYRNGATKADDRKIWHTDSHLKTLNNSKIIGVNNFDSLIKEVEVWN